MQQEFAVGKKYRRVKKALSKGLATFDIDDPELPKAVDEAALTSGGFPYDRKLDKDTYETELTSLQIELVKLQASLLARGARLVVLFEGRDAAGKGSIAKRFSAHLNARRARTVALAKPTETEMGQWYFQRYTDHMPSRGEIVLFDRSWYNRAGVERVMGFCTPDQLADFLREAPQFEGMLVRDGIHLFKFYLEIGREMQWKRFHERRHDPLKSWKINDIDRVAVGKWDDYTRAKEEMFRFTHTATSPWTVILANDQRRARIEAIRTVLAALDYEDKSRKVVGTPDPLIVGSGPEFFYRR
jgi:polyphosphate kinase 2